MRPFIFPRGQVWILDDPNEVAVATLEGGELALLVFSDEDLATTYASDAKLSGKRVGLIEGGQNLIGFLNGISKLGATHLVVDHTIGEKAHAVTIEMVIDHVQKQIE